MSAQAMTKIKIASSREKVVEECYRIQKDLTSLTKAIFDIQFGNFENHEGRRIIHDASVDIQTHFSLMIGRLVTLGVLVWEEDTLYHVLRDIEADLKQEA